MSEAPKVIARHPLEAERGEIDEMRTRIESIQKKISEFTERVDEARARIARADETIATMESRRSSLSEQEMRALDALKASRDGYENLARIARSTSEELAAHMVLVQNDYEVRVKQWKNKLS